MAEHISRADIKSFAEIVFPFLIHPANQHPYRFQDGQSRIVVAQRFYIISGQQQFFGDPVAEILQVFGVLFPD